MSSPLSTARVEKPQSVDVLFEDREGTIWFGGSQGLQHLREDPFVTYSRTPPSENVAENEGALWPDAAGRLWFAPSTGGLYWRRGGTVQHIENKSLDKDVVYSITGGPNELWVGRQSGGLTRVDLGNPLSTQTYTARDGLATGSVYSVYRSRGGAIWAGTIGGGVSRFQDGRFQTFATANGLASNSVTAIEEAGNGTMWFATTGGLSALFNGKWRTYTEADGLPPGDIASLAADGPVLWIGTSAGLAMLRDGHVITLAEVPAMLHETIIGIAPAPATVWIATGQSVVQVNRDRLLAGKIDSGDVRVFDAADGLRGTENLKRYRSVITDNLGRVWFSTNRGVAVVDPSALARRSLPVIAHIQTVTADGRALGDEDEAGESGTIRIPAAPHRVAFSFIGLSLADPARVLFRYRLDGYDTAWSNPTPAREAAYTNLGPGPYRFHVIARNSAGAWSPAEAATAISIAPLFWQTWWFQLCSVVIFAIAIIASYRLRLRQVTGRLNLRFEERLAERNRIARELHDTLLQNMAGLSLHISALSKTVTESGSTKEGLVELKRLAEACLRETRQSVWDLRTDSETVDLSASLRESGRQFTAGRAIRFALEVEGNRRPLKTHVRQQLLRIGREAISNAVKHASPTRIEARLGFEVGSIRLRVSDDGQGFDPIAAARLEGHFGLATMKERAEQIKGSLHISSTLGKGSCVEITVSIPE